MFPRLRREVLRPARNWSIVCLVTLFAVGLGTGALAQRLEFEDSARDHAAGVRGALDSLGDALTLRIGAPL